MFVNSLSRKGTGAAGLGVVSIASYLTINRDEGKKRSAKFWINAFPMYMQYRYVQFLNRDMKVISDEYASKWYDELHERFTDRTKELTYEMKGFYLKQVCLLTDVVISTVFFYMFT